MPQLDLMVKAIYDSAHQKIHQYINYTQMREPATQKVILNNIHPHFLMLPKILSGSDLPLGVSIKRTYYAFVYIFYFL